MAHHEDRIENDNRVTLGDNDSMKTASAGQLVHLDDLDDFKIADGEPDIRGWDVRGADGTKVGTVEDLLIDTASMKVRYIEVKLERDVATDVGRSASLSGREIPTATMRAEAQIAEHDQHHQDDDKAGRFILVPIGVARLNDDDDNVMLSAEAAQMVGIPAYNRHGDGVSRDYENEVVRGYGSGLGTGGVATGGATTNDVMRAARPSESQGNGGDKFYEERSFDDRSFFGNRRAGRDDDAYFMRADQDERSRARQRDGRGLDSIDDDLTDGGAPRNEMHR